MNILLPFTHQSHEDNIVEYPVNHTYKNCKLNQDMLTIIYS